MEAMPNPPGTPSATTPNTGRSVTKQIAFAVFALLLVFAVGLVAVQVLPPTGPTYEVGTCLSGHVADPRAPQVRMVPCDQPHQYLVVKIIDPAVTLSAEICPQPYAGYISFETGGLEQKLRHLRGDNRVEAKYACLSDIDCTAVAQETGDPWASDGRRYNALGQRKAECALLAAPKPTN